MVVRITTWNVNGIRNPFSYQPWRDNRTFDGMFDILEADIVIMQELKIQRKDLRDDMVLVPGWDSYFSLPKHKKGYSGVGIYTRNSVCAPIRAEEGLLGVLSPPGSSTAYRDLPKDQSIGGYPSEEQLTFLDIDPVALDAEGRCVVLEFPAFVLFGIYSPANSTGLRDDFRFAFICAIDYRVRNLIAAGKRVIVTGDLNVSRGIIDTANSEETLRKEGLTVDDYVSTPNRRIFNQLLEGGEVYGERDEGREHPAMWDICRGFHPTRKAMYTHWEQKTNARPGNYGSRIDFVLCSLSMKSWFCDSNIQEGLMGSDHCPVYAEMKDIVEIDGKQVHLRDILNSPGTFEEGKRLREHSSKDICATSAKLLPDFFNRRSIRDMFGKQGSMPSATSTQNPFVSPLKTQSGHTVLADSTKLFPDKTENETGKTSPPKTNTTSLPTSTTPKPSQSPIAKKRAPSDNKPPPTKRNKSNTVSDTSNLSDKGQKSLKNFFAPTAPSSTAKLPTDFQDTEDIYEASEIDRSFLEVSDGTPYTQQKDSQTSDGQSQTHLKDISTDETKHQTLPLPSSPKDPPSPPLLVDPIVSKESWDKVFTKRAPPRCEGHGESCQLLKTKKPGFNRGREFWMCSRPLGPTGQKERNSQWRCPTFIWSSDWNSGTENNS